MKLQTAFIALILLPFISFSQNPDTLTNKTDKQGKKQGAWMKKDEKGRMQYKGQFKDDYEIGEFTYFYPNGEIKTVLQYSNKGMNSFVKIYNENEVLLSDGFFKNKKRDSLWNLYSEQGEKIAEERYKNGLKEGTWLVYDKGDIAESVEWRNNKRNGKYYKKFPLGDYMTAVYKNDLLEGDFKEYFESKKLALKGEYDEGEKNNNWEYYNSTGEVEKIEKWNKGFLIYTKIRIVTQNNSFLLRTDSIAYFYAKGSGTELMTAAGEKISCKNTIDNLTGEVDFKAYRLLNLNSKFYARTTAIKAVEEDAENEKLIIKLQPESPFPVYADEEAEKGLRFNYLEKK